MRHNNFDPVASFYDRLSLSVLGPEMQAIQTDHLFVLPSGARVLMIGGGTGWIIPLLFERCRIEELVYVEASSSMIAQARQQAAQRGLEHRVSFIHGTELDVASHERFDAVLTFFLFDLFVPVTQEKMVRAIVPLLKKEGYWLWADFASSHTWYPKLMMRLMYLFFRTFCRIEAHRLYDVHPVFMKAGMVLEQQQFRKNHWLLARVYRAC